MKIVIQEIHQDKRIDQFFQDHWKSDFIVSGDERLYGHDLDGCVVFNGEAIAGLLTYHLKNNECEIVSIDSLHELQGIGTALIERMIEKAKELKVGRLWLMTTNDNVDAMRFYQKRGFVFKAIYPNAIEESRKLKQNIPEFGNYGIPIRDEIEMEYLFE